MIPSREPFEITLIRKEHLVIDDSVTRRQSPCWVQPERIKAMARMKGSCRLQVSVNKLFDEWSAQMLTEMDVEHRFQMMAAKGDTQAALRILKNIDQTHLAN